jgi:hypothetical protein
MTQDGTEDQDENRGRKENLIVIKRENVQQTDCDEQREKGGRTGEKSHAEGTHLNSNIFPVP